jgi:hypothetical protein
VLTKDILFGMNIVTLAGFVLMGITLTLNRTGQAGKALSIGLMAEGGIRRTVCGRRALPPAVALACPPIDVRAQQISVAAVSDHIRLASRSPRIAWLRRAQT